MQWEITPAARDYIRIKGGQVYVILERRKHSCGCCGSTEVESPLVRLGEPQREELEQYQRIALIDITVFVHSSLQGTSMSLSPKIDVEWTLLGRKLVLYGLLQE